MTKLLGSLALAAMAAILTPQSAIAEHGVRINASFTVAFTQGQNTGNLTHCGTAVYPYAVTANGAGYSKLGALSFELQKTISAMGVMRGCTTLRSPKGDALYATYAGTYDGGSKGEGTLTFTGGTGRFAGATGSAKFTGVFIGFYPTLTIFGGGAMPALQGTAFYLIDGTVQLKRDQDDE